MRFLLLASCLAITALAVAGLAVADFASAALAAVAAEYQIAFANEAAGRLFDRSAAELTGSPLVWVMADEKVVAAVRAGGSGKPETQLIERPGKQHLRVYAAPVSPGSNWRALLFIQDL